MGFRSLEYLSFKQQTVSLWFYTLWSTSSLVSLIFPSWCWSLFCQKLHFVLNCSNKSKDNETQLLIFMQNNFFSKKSSVAASETWTNRKKTNVSKPFKVTFFSKSGLNQREARSILQVSCNCAFRIGFDCEIALVVEWALMGKVTVTNYNYNCFPKTF